MNWRATHPNVSTASGSTGGFASRTIENHPWHICIVIPARNEEKLLPRCLRSILSARPELPVTTDIVIAADCSTDRTYQLAIEALGSAGTAIRTNIGVVGAARAVAAEIALARCPAPWSRCWLANTDADCVIPPTWLRDQLRFAQRGIEAVAGTINIDNFDEHEREVAERFRSSYRIEPDGSHLHVHGANLGVRADTYLRAGGWAHLSTAEDHDLWRRIGSITAATVSTSRVEIMTSGRRVGRAPHGFAAALAAHNRRAA